MEQPDWHTSSKSVFLMETKPGVHCPNNLPLEARLHTRSALATCDTNRIYYIPMQLLRPLTLICLLGTLVFGACSSYKIRPDLHAAIIGTWKGETSGAYLTIYSDGRFILENASGVADGTDILGTIERGRDMLLFTYNTPSALCPKMRGVYNFAREGDVLTISVVNEECPERSSQLDSSWALVNRTPTPTGK